MFAASRGKTGVVKLLLAYGADAAIKNCHGHDAATLAKASGFPALAREMDAPGRLHPWPRAPAVLLNFAPICYCRLAMGDHSLGTEGWVRIAWTGFLLSVGVAAGFIWVAPRLAALGLTWAVFYLVLFPLGLSAAAFLFKAMKSSAALKGRRSGLTLELGGPVVAFLLVMGGGYAAGRPNAAFDVVVRVHGPSGPTDIIRHGTVRLDIGTDRRNKSIDDQGEAHFSEIPARFAGSPALLVVDVAGYQRADPDIPPLQPHGAIYLRLIEITPRPRPITGQILDIDQHGLADVRVSLPALGQNTTTDRDGIFRFVITNRDFTDGWLNIEKDGYQPDRANVTVGTTTFSVILHKAIRAQR